MSKDNDRIYIKNYKETNTFPVIENEKQLEKDHILRSIETAVIRLKKRTEKNSNRKIRGTRRINISKCVEVNNDEITKLKQTKTLFKKLITYSKIIFYAVDKIIKSLLNRPRMSFYPKVKLFIRWYEDLDDKNISYMNNENNTKLPFHTTFVEQIKNIDRSTLHRIRTPFELFDADIANVWFFSK